MRLGRIEGKVWATIKDDRLEGIKLVIMQPVNEYDRPLGTPVVAVDTVGATEGDLVYWVNSTEASFVVEERPVPSETSIVGLVDRMDVLPQEEVEV